MKHNNSGGDSWALASTRLRTPTAARHAGTDQRAIHHKGGVAGSGRREGGFAKETEGLHAGAAQSGRPHDAAVCERLGDRGRCVVLAPVGRLVVHHS